MTTACLASPTTLPTSRSKLRTGPPLDYVSEKTRYGLESLHQAIGRLRKESASWRDARYAFYNVLKAHLALNNMLALINESDMPDRILAMKQKHFGEWLDRIDREGSTTG